MSETSDTALARGQWSTRLAFILAATGSAVGLGNIWKFPYITGENGGGAFVLVYLACIALLGLPMLVAELLIGRTTHAGPVQSFIDLADKYKASRLWAAGGLIGVIAAFLVLSFYSVVGGWTLAYLIEAAQGVFQNSDKVLVDKVFSELIASPFWNSLWHSVFMLATISVIVFGVNKGIERAVSILMPAMFILLIILVAYAATTPGFSQSLQFLFSPDFSKLTASGVLEALGHAFFTLSLGLAIMLTYGSYLGKDVSIGKTAITVGFLDTLVALLAGLAIFSVVFSNGLEAGAGPGLVFKTLPISFGAMPGGYVIGIFFFVMLLLAAWSSAISITEPCVAALMDATGLSRLPATLIIGFSAWSLGLAAALSFNDWGDISLWGRNIFDFLDYFTTNILLPLGCIVTAIFCARILPRSFSRDALAMGETSYNLWLFVLRFVTPVLIAIVFVYKVFPNLFSA